MRSQCSRAAGCEISRLGTRISRGLFRVLVALGGLGRYSRREVGMIWLWLRLDDWMVEGIWKSGEWDLVVRLIFVKYNWFLFYFQVPYCAEVWFTKTL